MPREVVYSSDIQNAQSILDILNGSAMFHIANPWFKVDGVKPVDLNSFLKPVSESKYGVILSSAQIYVKVMPTRPFTSQFTIAWTKARGVKKDYYVMKPYEIDTVGNNVRQKIIISPRGEFTEDDAKLVQFDNQMAMMMDIIFIAKILDINLSTYSDLRDNTKFFGKFIADITNAFNKVLDSDSQLAKDDIKLKKAYVDSFINPPTYMSKDKKHIPVEQLGKPKTQIESIWKLFYDIYSNCDLESKFPKWKGIISENSTAMPSIRFVDVVNKTTSAHEKRFDTRITLMLKLNEGDQGFNPKIKDFMLTQRLNQQKKFEYLTTQNIHSLWGGTLEDPKASKGCTQTGCIFLIPQLNFQFFKTGRPTIEWRVEQIAVNKAVSALTGGYDDAMAFMDDQVVDECVSNENQFNETNEIPF